MRMRLLVIWITLTALLQWSTAQEDTMQEVGLSGGIESPEPEEGKSPEMQEDMNDDDHSTTAMPVVTNLEKVPQEPGEPTTNTVDMPANGTRAEEIDHHQSGEDKKEQQAAVTKDMPSDGNMISVKDPLSADDTTPPPEVQETDKDQPTNQKDFSSEADSHIPKEPPATPEGGKLPDYPEDSPFEDNDPKVEVTPPAPAPVYRYQNCYSCLNCNATDDQKTTCRLGAGDRSGCFTMIVKNKNLLPTQINNVERGCTSVLTDAFLRYCENNNELCLRCEANYCNVHDMTKLRLDPAGGASTPRLLGPLLIGSICLASCWRRQVFY